MVFNSDNTTPVEEVLFNNYLHRQPTTNVRHSETDTVSVLTYVSTSPLGRLEPATFGSQAEILRSENNASKTYNLITNDFYKSTYKFTNFIRR